MNESMFYVDEFFRGVPHGPMMYAVYERDTDQWVFLSRDKEECSDIAAVAEYAYLLGVRIGKGEQ